jgi:DNA-binding transcriptional LysR family regulator
MAKMAEIHRVESRLKLHDLKILVSVVEEGSMSKAAKTLATSQPAVSRAIAELEHLLGVRLLDRDPHGIVPTVYGEALLKRSVAVFDELRLGVKDIQSLADPTAGEIRIAAQIALATGFVPAVIDNLSRRYPRIVCRLTTSEPEGVFRKLEDREVDLAMVYLTSAVDADRMEAQVLFPASPLVVVAGTKNPFARRRNVRLADLMSEPWALTQPENQFSQEYVFQAAGLDPPVPAVIADSIPARLALAAGGRFLTIMSEPILRFAGNGMALKVLPIHLPRSRYDIGFVTLRNRTLTSAAQHFIECARELARLLPVRKTVRVDTLTNSVRCCDE